MSGKELFLRCCLLVVFIGTLLLLFPEVQGEDTPAEKDWIDCRFKAQLKTSGTANEVVVRDEYAYIADSRVPGSPGKGLVIADISDPTNPEEEGDYCTGDTLGMTIQGDYAYMADYDYFSIIDMSNKSAPRKVGDYQLEDGSCWGLTVDGDYAYVGASSKGLLIVDISNRSNPKKVSCYDSEGKVVNVVVRGDYAYLADHDDGLKIIDISNKSDPKKLGRFDMSGSLQDIALVDDYAYLAYDESGMVIMDISDKEAPMMLGRLNTKGKSWGITVRGNLCFVADEENGLVIIDITNKSDPRMVGGYSTTDDARDVFLDGNLAYVAQSRRGLLILELAPVAWIDELSTISTLEEQVFKFQGYGTDDGELVRYAWRSSIDGEFYNGSEEHFKYSGLSGGNHTLFFKVQDSFGTWSEEQNISLLVNQRPVSSIEGVSPNPSVEGTTISFTGSGNDDGIILRYAWRSSLDGEFYNDSSRAFSYSLLSLGTHTVFLKVLDSNGTWSEEDQTEVVIATTESLARPVAEIKSINPETVVVGTKVFFSGGEKEGGSVERYVWRSSLDGEFYNGSVSIATSTMLTLGTHTIFLRIQGENGRWSSEVSATVTIQEEGTGGTGDPDDEVGYIPGFEIAFVLLAAGLATELKRKP